MGGPVTLDMSQAQPIQAAPPVSLDMSKAEPINSPPGFLKRFGQSLGVPTSEEEFERAIAPVTIGGIPIAPGGSGLKTIVDYGKNLYEKGKQFIQAPSAESGARAILATTPSGGTQQNIAEDTAAGNYRGAAGGATGLAVQAALPEASKRVAPIGSSLAETVEAIADHPITAAMRKTIDLATFERLGKIYDAWANQMPAAMKARAAAMRPVYPGAPLPEHPGVFPGAPLPENPGTFPGAPLPATPLPEQTNPSLVSQARTLPGMHSPEVIRPGAITLDMSKAEPIPARTGLQLTGEVAGQAKTEAARPPSYNSDFPRTLSGESALREILDTQPNKTLLQIARSRGVNVSREALLKPTSSVTNQIINKIIDHFSDDELDGIRSQYLENERFPRHQFGEIGKEANQTLNLQTYFPELRIPQTVLNRTAKAIATRNPQSATVSATAAKPQLDAAAEDLSAILQESLKQARERRPNQ